MTRELRLTFEAPSNDGNVVMSPAGRSARMAKVLPAFIVDIDRIGLERSQPLAC